MSDKDEESRQEEARGQQDGESKDKQTSGAAGADKKPEPKPQSTTDWLASMMKKTLLLGGKEEEEEEKPPQVLSAVSVDGVVEYIKSGKCQHIVTMAGAGISTSAGIPDFRSPGTGLYDNLQKYNLPHPQAIFEIGFFKENPEPFFQLAKELYPGVFKPTPCHYFIRLLHEKGLLLRHYTQNIDTLERVAGLEGEKIIEAHGTFHTAHCLDCRHQYTQEYVRERVFTDEIPRCSKEDCNGVVKPDIVFFGEALPMRFFQCAQSDMAMCDLLVVMGISLVVQPFASLANRVPEACPRLYVNLEKGSGSGDPLLAALGMGHGFQFDSEDNYRDVFLGATCDDGCLSLAEKLGWKADLEKLMHEEYARIDKHLEDQKAAVAQAKVKAESKKEESKSSDEEKPPTAKPSSSEKDSADGSHL